MAHETALTPERRVRIIVGGGFNRAALGDAYDAIIAGFEADPLAHLEAFRRLYLTGEPDRTALANLPLVNVIRRVMRTHPQQAADAARELQARMAALGQTHEHEAMEATTIDAANELNRERRQLRRHREGLAMLMRGN
jgi:hypothetical protein